MKRKVAMTMAIAFWVDDKYLEPGEIHSNETWLENLGQWDEMDFVEEGQEFAVINYEITETKE